MAIRSIHRAERAIYGIHRKEPAARRTGRPAPAPVALGVARNPGLVFWLAKERSGAQKRVAMNKAELVEAIQKALGKDATKRAAEDALAAVLGSIEKGIKGKDKKVQIIGFGTFDVKKRAARMGRNPKTGEAMKIAASKSVGFKASSTLKAGL
jgi:DNA-binding protein HU-beta